MNAQAPRVQAVADCQAGRISPEVALARLVLQGHSLADIARMLPTGSALAALFRAQESNLRAVSRMLADARVDHGGARTTQDVAAMFDRAVKTAPEASVAAYALNDPALLARATSELVDWLLAQGYARAGARVLDLGCGIGRVAAALAPHVGDVMGADVSPGMIAEAQRRHGTVANLSFSVADGAPDMPAASLDLVLAVDSFPYMVQACVADCVFAELAQSIKPGGVLAVLNLSYGTPAEDRALAALWSAVSGMALEIDGSRPFTLWDGTAFVWRARTRDRVSSI